ncbi:MAG TPA: hypothetical protein VIL97_04325 [Thermoanaerobaculia bacterium]
MKLPHGLSAQEIRLLQEFRRLEKEELTNEEIASVKHPATPGGDLPAVLAEKGWLAPSGTDGRYALTEKSKELLAFDPVPIYEREG